MFNGIFGYGTVENVIGIINLRKYEIHNLIFVRSVYDNNLNLHECGGLFIESFDMGYKKRI